MYQYTEDDARWEIAGVLKALLFGGLALAVVISALFLSIGWLFDTLETWGGA